MKFNFRHSGLRPPKIDQFFGKLSNFSLTLLLLAGKPTMKEKKRKKSGDKAQAYE
jgi:hypothetical protein